MGDANLPELELADIDNSRGWLTGKKLPNPLLCTASDAGLCHIFRELHTWNEFLCRASMQLIEERPGQLTLSSCHSLAVRTYERDENHCAATLAFWLLKNHRCVARFDVNSFLDMPDYGKLIVSGLESSPLKKLQISETLSQTECTVIAPMLKYLTKLEELHWQCCTKYIDTCFPESLCSLVETASSLSTLSIPNVNIEADDGKRLLSALGRNTTIKKLGIGITPFITSTEDNATSFREYVTNNKVLTTLEMTGRIDMQAGYLKSAVSCVGLSESLVSVTFRVFLVDEGAASAIEAYLNHNGRVLWFSLEKCLWRYWSPSKRWEPSHRIDPWLSILRNSRSLQNLQLNLEAFSTAECDAFFEELATSRSLKQVIIEDLGSHPCQRVQEMCRNLSTTKLLNTFLCLPDTTMVPEEWCREVYQIKILRLDQPVTPSPHRKQLCMPPENVTTKLYLNFWDSTEELGTLVAEYITRTKVLTELTLVFLFDDLPGSPSDPEFKKKILRSLLLNSSVKKVCLEASSLTEGEVTLLARVVKDSKHILEYFFFMDGHLFGPVVEQLSPHFDRNYNVISVRRKGTPISSARHWYRVSETIRRNVSLRARAFAFVAGSRDRRNAEALELVASTPALVDKICEELHVGKSEAVRKVRESVNSLQGISDFMIASGVVRSALRCHPRQDLQLQLTDLDEYSWLVVRKYLRIGDVLCDEQLQGAQLNESV